MDTLTKAELNLENLRGQGYDGSGNISGKDKGASTIILNKNTKATYVHCRSHVLNISIVNVFTCMQNAINSKYDGYIIRNLHIF